MPYKKVVKKDIRSLNPKELKENVIALGEKAFRSKQIYNWLWVKKAQHFDEMTNLSLKTRDLLKQNFAFNTIELKKQQKSNDGTIKSAFSLHDGSLIEGVLIPADQRMTACVSSQIGCSLTCSFCATGQMKLERNLTAGEIFDQVAILDQISRENYDKPLSNIVYMGMGEPLLNYKQVLKSIDRLTAADGLNMSPSRITVSTAGISKMIRKLADDQVKFNLALSMHAATDLKRNQIMPINESNSLNVLQKDLSYFYEKTGNRITLEYIAFNNFNDNIEDAKHLHAFVKRVPCRVNVIEYNQVEGVELNGSEEDRLTVFSDYLKNAGVNIHVRRSRGKDIDAACGQLANKE